MRKRPYKRKHPETTNQPFISAMSIKHGNIDLVWMKTPLKYMQLRFSYPASQWEILVQFITCHLRMVMSGVTLTLKPCYTACLVERKVLYKCTSYTNNIKTNQTERLKNWNVIGRMHHRRHIQGKEYQWNSLLSILFFCDFEVVFLQNLIKLSLFLLSDHGGVTNSRGTG